MGLSCKMQLINFKDNIVWFLVCSTTIWAGHMPKIAQQASVSELFEEHGPVKSVDVSESFFSFLY